MLLDLAGQVAIVTGAAHGFGRAICQVLAGQGAMVYAIDYSADELAETAAQIQAQGYCCLAVVCDVTDSAAVQAVAERIVAEQGRIDILVNNAGGVVGQVGKPIEQVQDAEWAIIVQTNLAAVFYWIRAVAPTMKSQQAGRIINISSGAGRSYSLTGIQAYASAKAGQIGLTRQMAKELGAWGITVNNIAPGFVLSNPSTERQWHAMGNERQHALVEGLALKRLGSPNDIAHAVLFFASAMAGWVTGQTISVDGGSHMV
ncbi:MAG: 3-oxoacyl-[acyl-carrier-protein] reductase [Roseiflexaceae bacterium]